MIQIERKIEIKCSKDNFEKALLNFNEVYPKYSPNEHIKCEYIRGNLLTENSILYFEEFIADKKQQMKYKVVKIKDQNDVKVIYLKALFPRSLFNIKARFKLTTKNDNVEFERRLTLGTEIFFLGFILDKLTFLLGKKYIDDIKTHEQKDLSELKQYLETEFA